MAVRLVPRSDQSVDSDSSVEELISDAINIVRRGHRTDLAVCWEVGKRVHRVSESANAGDRVLKDFAKKMTEATGESYSEPTLSRFRAIHRLIPESSEVEKLADAGVRRTHLYRLIHHDVPAEQQRKVLDMVLEGKIPPTNVDNTVSKVLSGESLQEGEDPEETDDHSQETASAADTPEVIQLKKRISQTKKAVEIFKEKTEKFSKRINDDFDGLDRPQQEEVEPGLTELLDTAIAAQKSAQVLVNSLKGCI